MPWKEKYSWQYTERFFSFQDMAGLFSGETPVQTTRTPWLWQLQCLALALSALAILAFRVQIFGWRIALLLTAAGLAAVILLGFLGLLILFAKLRSGRQQSAGRHCLLATVLSLPVLIGVLLLGMRGAKVPPIHDITTDPIRPPVLSAAASQRGPADNSVVYDAATVAGQQRQAYADIAPLKTAMAPTQAYARALALARELGWRIVVENQAQGVIEAEDRSLIFGFIDDIAIRVTAEGTGSRVDLRSASRAGVSDLGVNAQRGRNFSHQFNTPQLQ